jgi:CRP-like cAMP-binding protein
MERLDHLRLFHPISVGDYAFLAEHLKSKRFKKGEFITTPGQVQKDLYFIVSGVQMSYVEEQEKMHVIAFTYPPGVCAIPESFSFQTPSKYYLKCIEDTETEHISHDKLQQLFDRSHQLERLFRKMTEAILAGMINRHVELHTMSIEERYQAFCQRSPHLLQMVPQKYIASYLGIDPTNFSKLYNTVKIG